jgi:hypothetical protein
MSDPFAGLSHEDKKEILSLLVDVQLVAKTLSVRAAEARSQMTETARKWDELKKSWKHTLVLVTLSHSRLS